jgi:hypothetical protein
MIDFELIALAFAPRSASAWVDMLFDLFVHWSVIASFTDYARPGLLHRSTSDDCD